MVKNIKESEKMYLTDKLFYYKNKTYYENENKIIKLGVRNWVKYMSDYGWFYLDDNWKKRLINKRYCFRYGLLDCGGSGDCLFHCISEACNELSDMSGEKYNSNDIRKIAANSINKDNYQIIIENYRLEKENNEFDGLWDPDTINNYKELQNEIIKSGNNFWGDHIILQLLKEKMDLNIIILNSDCCDNPCKINLFMQKFHKINKTIILYYIDKIHFQLVGYFNGNKMQTIFDTDKIPKNLIKLCKEDTSFVI